MAEKKIAEKKIAEKKKENVFKRAIQRIVRRFVEVRQEMKRVIWPTRTKLLQVAVVVLAVILASAIFLSLVGQGTSAILKSVGFYNQVSETTAATATTTTAVVSTDATTAATTAA
ncbi:MAG: preprotein translocase subunit SecE [Eubacteriales bacterium]